MNTMPTSKELLSGFPEISKEAWLARIERDLKGKPMDALYWQLEDDLVVDPFGHPDDFAAPPAPLHARAGWEITEFVEVTQADTANAQILDALRMGAESLHLHLAQLPALAAALEGVHLGYIHLYISTSDWSALPPAQVLLHLRALEKDTLRGALRYDPLGQSAYQDWPYLTELAQMAGKDFPAFRVVSVGLPGEVQGAHVTDDLAQLLYQGHRYLTQLTRHGLSAAEADAQLRFRISIGKSYFLEIARLRAFGLLWMNVQKAWGLPPQMPLLDVSFNTEGYTDELHTNMIRATTMAMSGVLGGAATLEVRPFDEGRRAQSPYPEAFSRRIARNVQHVLKMESFLDAVPDPAAGSYYIEKLTRQLADKAWARFRALNV
jgi:methylmalonyl-CoA mutase